MGFRSYRAFNEAMLARQGWGLLMNPHSFWARFMKGIYFPNSSFLRAIKGSRASWAWTSMLHGRNLLTNGLRWQVQDGSSINFWEDRWIPSLKDFKIHSARPPDSDIQTVADVIDSSSGLWKVQKLALVVSPSELNASLSISLPAFSRRDRLIWHHTPKGIYSVKSGYHLAT